MSSRELISFRFEKDSLQAILNYFQVTNNPDVRSNQEIYTDLFQKLHSTVLQLQVSNQTIEQKPLNEELTCKLRILSGKSYYCINRPPKATRLLNLDVCKVCLAIFRGLNDKTKRLGSEIEQAQKTPTLAPISDPIANGLAKGHLTKYCAIEKHAYPLLQLPCVKNTENPEEKTGCRFSDCEVNVRNALVVHLRLNSKPSG